MSREYRMGVSFARLFAMLLLGMLAFVGWAPSAEAAPSCQASSATLSMPSTVVIQPNAPAGAISGATGIATVTFNCSGLPASKASADYTATIQAGQTLATLDPTNNTNGPGITFATGISGLAVLVTATPVQATSNACLACGPTSTQGYVPGAVTAPSNSKVGAYSGSVTANYSAQLIKTSSQTIPAGTIGPINLIPFWWYISGGSVDSTSLSLNAYLILPAITITVPTCTVSSGNNFSVVLPTVATSQLTTSGQVTGTTRFSMTLSNCPSGVSTAATYFSGTNIDSNTGNLINTASGGAQNVEVQLLNGPGSTALTAYSVINLSQSTASAQNSGSYKIVSSTATLNYFAQYYATGAATSGPVSTSVQYMINYQ